MRRLLEVLLHAGTTLGGWSKKEIHRAVLDRFSLTVAQHNLNSLRYDLRKLKGHGLLDREPKQYRYRLTKEGPAHAHPVPSFSPTPVRAVGREPV